MQKPLDYTNEKQGIHSIQQLKRKTYKRGAKNNKNNNNKKRKEAFLRPFPFSPMVSM